MMRLTTIVRISKDGVTGESVTVGEVSEGYGEEKLAARAIRDFRHAKDEVIVKLTAKRAAAELQNELFPGQDFSAKAAVTDIQQRRRQTALIF